MFVDFDFFLCSCDTTVMWMADSEEGPQLESQYMQIKRIGDRLQMLRYTHTSIFSDTWPNTILARVDSNNHPSSILLPLSIFKLHKLLFKVLHCYSVATKPVILTADV